MYFGLNVSYLGLFVLKKFGNLHQIYFYCSPENLLQGYIRADIYMVGICFLGCPVRCTKFSSLS